MGTVRRFVTAFVLICLFIGGAAFAAARREISFPNILGYKTLKCDLHTHTVFSAPEARRIGR